MVDGEDVGLVLRKELAEGSLALFKVGVVDFVVGLDGGPGAHAPGRGIVKNEVAPVEVEGLFAGRVHCGLRRRDVGVCDVRESARAPIEANSYARSDWCRAGKKKALRTNTDFANNDAKVCEDALEVRGGGVPGNVPDKERFAGGVAWAFGAAGVLVCRRR